MSNDSSHTLSSTWCWIGKLAPPKTLISSTRRETLLDALRTHGCKPLLLLVAPAGYGKTTLLMQWRQELLAQSDQAVVAWLSLDNTDTEPNRFLAYLILALQRAGLELGHLSRLAESHSLDTQPQRTITALLQALAQTGRPITLLVDDYHTAACPDVDHIVQTLVEQAAPWLQWGVASRMRPDWPLARWKAKGWIHQVTARELRLSLDETTRILGTDVQAAQVLGLHRTTEGWAVAVQLARLWRASNEGCLFGLNTFSGRVGDAAEYLAEQVLASLSVECQAFLIQTSLLERFNAELADTVRERNDSARLLTELSHLDALLVPLDAERQWFRYHGMLRDFLAPRVDTEQARNIHRAAAQWLGQGTDWVQAVAHALRAKETELAVNLLVRAGGWALVLRHGIRYAQSLIQLFDEQTRLSAPDLLLLQAYLHAKQGEHESCTQLLRLAENALHADPRLIRDFHVIRVLSNAYCDHFESASIALPNCENDIDTLVKATLGCVESLALTVRGEPQSALQVVRAAHVKMRLVASPRGESYCRIHEAQAMALSGKVAGSRHLIDETLTFVHSHFGGESSLKALVGCAKAQHCYWLGDWAESTPWLLDGWAALEHADGWLDMVAATAEVTWRTALRSHGLQPALRELERTAALASTRGWERLGLLVSAWRIDLLVQCGWLTQARKEVLNADLQSCVRPSRDWRSHEAATLALARVQIASGASQAAFNRLQREGALLREQGLLLPAWRLQLMALAAACRAEIALCEHDIMLALEPVAEQNLPGLLLEVGPWLLPALEQAPHVLPAILTRLRGWRAHPVRPKMPLSAKQTQVLALLASGQSNKAIAQALDISENTVKFHLKNIFAQLSVDNRTAAISAALQQGLLKP